jgi:predicted patatin/cPLA2 family phospholipase
MTNIADSMIFVTNSLPTLNTFAEISSNTIFKTFAATLLSAFFLWFAYYRDMVTLSIIKGMRVRSFVANSKFSMTRKLRPHCSLSLSGGGSHGAYQIGCLKALNEFGYVFDSVDTVSVGSLAGAMIAQYSTDNQHEAIENLIRLWGEMTTDKVYNSWRLPLYNIYSKSLYDSTPLKNLITNNVLGNSIQTSNVKLNIATTVANTGELEIFNDSSPNIFDAIYAACIIPGAFQNTTICDKEYIDAGLNCHIWSSDSDMNKPLVCISTQPIEIGCDVGGSIFGKMEQYISIMLRSIYRSNKDGLIRNRPNILFLQPKKKNIGNALSFDPDTIQIQIGNGYNETMIRLIELESEEAVTCAKSANMKRPKHEIISGRNRVHGEIFKSVYGASESLNM